MKNKAGYEPYKCTLGKPKRVFNCRIQRIEKEKREKEKEKELLAKTSLKDLIKK